MKLLKDTLEEKSLIVAALVPLHKTRGMLKFLRKCVSQGKIYTEKRNAFEKVFIQSVNQIERKWRWTNWRICDESELIEKLMDFAWEFITSEESLIAVLLSQIMPTWNKFVNEEKLTFTMDRLLLYTKYINSTSISESCCMFLKMKDSVKLENEASNSFTCLPWERVMFSCLLVNEIFKNAYVEYPETANKVLNLSIENEKLSLTHKYIMAAICGSECVLNWLWDFDTEKELPEICNELSLYLTSKPATEKIVKWFVRHGTSVNCCDSNGNTLLHLASKAGHKDLIEDLLNNENEIQIDALNKFGKTPLRNAAEGGHISIMQKFLEKGANIDMKNNAGNAPLQAVIENCKEMTFKALSALGANTDMENSDEYKLIQTSINKRKIEIIKMAERSRDETPLHIACQLGSLQYVQKILESGCDATLSNSKQRTALHEASWNGHLDIVEFLLFKYDPQSINQQDIDGRTALHYATESNKDKSVVSLLITKGADVNIKSKSEKTALMLAVKRKNIFELILSKCDKQLLDHADKNGKTALHYAAEFCRDKSVVLDLMNSGASLTKLSKIKQTPLFLAASRGRKDIVNAFIEKCNRLNFLNSLDINGFTALSYAAENGHWDVVFALANKKASVNVDINRHKRTPLHKAIICNNINVVRKLLDKGANVNDKDSFGKNALNYSEELKRLEITELLGRRKTGK